MTSGSTRRRTGGRATRRPRSCFTSGSRADGGADPVADRRVGNMSFTPRGDTTRVPVLVEYLARLYPPDHEVVVYEASLYPIRGPNVQRDPAVRSRRGRHLGDDDALRAAVASPQGGRRDARAAAGSASWSRGCGVAFLRHRAPGLSTAACASAPRPSSKATSASASHAAARRLSASVRSPSSTARSASIRASSSRPPCASSRSVVSAITRVIASCARRSPGHAQPHCSASSYRPCAHSTAARS